jgi:CRISPR-associated protein (TIGR03984 family)
MNDERWQEITVDEKFEADPRQWLAGHARADMPWLLAHADDGVIWGKRESNGTLKLSSDVFADPGRYPAVAVKLRTQTLLQARVFGPGGELLLWRTEDGFAARLIEDGPEPPPDALPDEVHLLWGMGSDVEVRDGFTWLSEGQQGLRHAPPVSVAAVRNTSRLALLVRHYVGYDDEGQAFIELSRLVELVERGGRDESQA